MQNSTIEEKVVNDLFFTNPDEQEVADLPCI
jgi:hypothetical protein